MAEIAADQQDQICNVTRAVLPIEKSGTMNELQHVGNLALPYQPHAGRPLSWRLHKSKCLHHMQAISFAGGPGV